MEGIQDLSSNVLKSFRLPLSCRLVDDLSVALKVLLPQRVRDLPAPSSASTAAKGTEERPMQLFVRMERADQKVPVVFLLQRV